MNYIQGYCRIRDCKVIANGKELFSLSAPLAEFVERFYHSLNLSYPKFYKMDHLSKLGFLASEVLIRDSNAKTFSPYDVSVVLSNASSSLDTDKNYFETTKKAASPALFVYTLPNIVNGEISIRHGLKGESAFFVTPQFDPDLLCGYCDELLKEKSKLCLTGWVEVMGENYDVFLFLIGKDKSDKEHMVENIKSLYSA